MNHRFEKFLLDHHIFNTYMEHYDSNYNIRDQWHKDCEITYDFWDRRNWMRYVSAAFPWDKTPQGYAYWSGVSGLWKHSYRLLLWPEQLNKNTRTL